MNKGTFVRAEIIKHLKEEISVLGNQARRISHRRKKKEEEGRGDR